MFHEKSGPVWDALRELQQRLDAAKMPYVVIGGLALNAYHYPRQTVHVDVVLDEADFKRFVSEFAGKFYQRDPSLARRFTDPGSGVSVDVLIAGQIAGRRDKNTSVRFPDPAEGVVQGELRTVPLARLIELKLVTWRYKDRGDVVELIRRNHLTEFFADQFDPVVRGAFRECFDQATDPRYDQP